MFQHLAPVCELVGGCTHIHLVFRDHGDPQSAIFFSQFVEQGPTLVLLPEIVDQHGCINQHYRSRHFAKALRVSSMRNSCSLENTGPRMSRSAKLSSLSEVLPSDFLSNTAFALRRCVGVN